jgi:hypothetical protein
MNIPFEYEIILYDALIRLDRYPFENQGLLVL